MFSRALIVLTEKAAGSFEVDVSIDGPLWSHAYHLDANLDVAKHVAAALAFMPVKTELVFLEPDPERCVAKVRVASDWDSIATVIEAAIFQQTPSYRVLMTTRFDDTMFIEIVVSDKIDLSRQRPN